jgi:ATP-dependent HslUV protease ATP-binding subunit HslU
VPKAFDERMAELDVRERNFPSFEIISNQGRRGDGRQHQGHVAEHFGQRSKKWKMKVNEAFEYLIQKKSSA